jgi:WD40 repeat protein
MTEKRRIHPIDKPIWSQSLHGHPLGLAMPTTNSLVAAASVEGPIHAIDIETGRLVQRFCGHRGGTTALAPGPAADEFVSGGEDGAARLWRVGHSEATDFLEPTGHWVEAVAAAPSGALFASRGRHLFLHAREASEPAAVDLGTTALHLAMRPDGRHLIAAGHGGIRCLALDSGGELPPFPFTATPVSLAISPDGQWIACGTSDMGLRLYRIGATSGNGLGIGPLGNKPRAVSWASDSEHLALGSGEQVYLLETRLLEAASTGDAPLEEVASQALRHLADLVGRCSAVAFHPVEPWLAMASRDGHLLVEDLGFGRRLLDIFLGENEIVSLAWTADSDRLITAESTGTISCFWIHPR